jgi:cobalt/nickel transport system ATP-binding protein
LLHSLPIKSFKLYRRPLRLEPQILLLDEPTAYLGRLHIRNLMAMLKNIHTSGTTIVMATHDLDLAYCWADWVFVMDRGKLILEGKPEDVFTQRNTLEELKLGLPLALEVLSSEEFAFRGDSSYNLKQQLLNWFGYI